MPPGDKILALTDLLDVTPRVLWPESWVPDSVWIPGEELTHRVYELGPSKDPIRLTGVTTPATIDWLESRCHPVTVVPEVARVREKPTRRLWKPSELLPDAHPGQALDIGCGAGRDSVQLASQGWRVTAIDHLPDAVAIARRLGAEYAPSDIRFITNDFLAVDLESQFGLICMIRSFRPQFLPKAMTLVAPLGRLVIEAFIDGRKVNVASKEMLAATFAAWTIERLTTRDNIIQMVAQKPANLR